MVDGIWVVPNCFRMSLLLKQGIMPLIIIIIISVLL